MSQRVLLVTINYRPELTGIGKYTGEMAEWLVSRGCEVRVVTAPPYYPAWKVNEGYSAAWYQREAVGGVEVLRCPLWVPGKVSGIKRVLHLASFAITSFFPIVWGGVRWRPDLVLVIEPPLFAAPAAWLAARLGRAVAWLHVQDFEVDAAFDLGILRSELLRRWVLALERLLLSRFDRVSSISERMVDRLVRKGVDPEKRKMFPNWVELDRVFPLQEISPLRREWGYSSQDVVVLYSGNMGEKQGLEILLETASRLKARTNIHWVLCGEGAARARLEAQARGMEKVRFLPLQPIDRLNELLNAADIHVLPQRADAADLVLPSKVTNMMASGRPVVATAASGTQLAELVEGCGHVVAPGDSLALAGAIEKLADDPDGRQRMGAEARVRAERLWDKQRILEQQFGEWLPCLGG